MATESKADSGANKNKKRKQRYLPHNKPVKKKGINPLRPGIQGFFITCDGGKERQAAYEAINVIDSFFEEILHGKDNNANSAAAPSKPLNKKIKFTYSDSSDDEDEDGADEEVNKLESYADADANTGYPGNGKSDCGEDVSNKNQINEATGDSKDNVKENDGNNTSEIEEPPAKKQCYDSAKLKSGGPSLDKTEMSVDKLIEAELEELGDKNKLFKSEGIASPPPYFKRGVNTMTFNIEYWKRAEVSSNRRFLKLDSGCNGIVFIQMRKRDGDPNPKEIVQHMMESAASTKKHMSRFMLRVLPVLITCYASEEEISSAIKPTIAQYFPAESEIPVKFSVLYDARANTGIDRMKIIDVVAKSVPAPHKVDLKDPEKSIVVQIIKTVCLIGVVEKYKELAKYNLRQLTSPKA